MLENFQGDSWGSIPPLCMPSLLPHDLCHGRSSSRWLLAVIEFQLSYSRSWKMMLWKVLHSICNMPAPSRVEYIKPLPNFRTFSSPQKRWHTPTSSHSTFSFPFSPQQLPIYFVMDLPLLDIVWKNNHICGPLCLLSFTWHKVFKILSCCSIHEYFIPFNV